MIINLEYKFNLKVLENLSQKFQRYIHLVEKNLSSPPTQINLLSYAIETLIDKNWDGENKDEERLAIIRLIKGNYILDKIIFPEMKQYDKHESDKSADIGNEPNDFYDEENDYSDNKRYDEIDLALADWDYNPSTPAHNPSENIWIEILGPVEEAEIAYYNTH
jgi:hypothetical protein